MSAQLMIGVLRAASDERAAYAREPDADLGVGHEPTPDQCSARRKSFEAGASVLASLADYAEAVEAESGIVRQDGRDLARAAHLVCSATSERLDDIAVTMPCRCGGDGCEDCES